MGLPDSPPHRGFRDVYITTYVIWTIFRERSARGKCHKNVTTLVDRAREERLVRSALQPAIEVQRLCMDVLLHTFRSMLWPLGSGAWGVLSLVHASTSCS